MKRGKRKLNYVCKLILNAILLRVDISTSAKLEVNLLKKKRSVSDGTRKSYFVHQAQCRTNYPPPPGFFARKWIKSKTES